MKASLYPNNTGNLRQKINNSFSAINRWFLNTPERALEQAYKAVLTIKSIEDEHFNGTEISAESAEHSDTVMFYFQAELEKHLNIAKLRLAEFKASRSFISISNSLILEKIRFIDEVIAKYTIPQQSTSLAVVSNYQQLQIDSNKVKEQPYSEPINVIDVEPVTNKTGVLPRSIGRTINRIKNELTPEAEKEVVKNFQNSRAKTKVAVRFILTLILVPFLTQLLFKQFLVSPIVNHVRGENHPQVFLNSEMKEEALRELHSFEEELKFASLINQAPQLSPEALEEQVKHKATEILEEFRSKSANAISNVFADLIAVLAFALVIITSQREIIIFKSFMDDVIYGLSDSAKAFIIILLTDTFVGFHSPHGWEVVLEGLASHLGIAANKNLIFIFIATFPVILDTIFKYWIFRYLSRISPSAVATFRNMKE